MRAPLSAQAVEAEELYRAQRAESTRFYMTHAAQVRRLPYRELLVLAERRWGWKTRWHCVYCGRSTGLVIDHFVPLRNGGTNQPENLVPCCSRCNSSKQDRDPIAWMAAVGVPQRRIDILATVTELPEWRAPHHLQITRADLDYTRAYRAIRAQDAIETARW